MTNTKGKLVFLAILMMALTVSTIQADWEVEQIESIYDDGMITTTGAKFFETPWVEIKGSSVDIISFFAFRVVNIPDNATIVNATLQFTAPFPYNYNQSLPVTIYGIKTGDLESWNPTPDLNSEPFTIAFTNWDVDPLVSSASFNVSVTEIVNEIYQMYNWTNGNDMGFRISSIAISGGTRYQAAYDSDPANSLKLFIDYTAADSDSTWYKDYKIEELPSGPGNNTQPFGAGYAGTLHTSTTKYNTLQGGSQWETPEDKMAQVVSSNGTLHNLRVKLTGNAGAGSYNFTIYKNGVPTSLACSVPVDSGDDLINQIEYVAGDTLSIECDPINNPNAESAYWSLLYTNENANYSNIMGGSWTPLSNAQTEYGGLMSSRTVLSITANDYRQVMPTNGTLRDFFVDLNIDPGNSPDGYNFTIHKNGVQTSFNVTIYADDTAGQNIIETLDVVAGDILLMQIDPLNAPLNTPYAHWSITLVAETAGESVIMGGSNDALPQVTTEYNTPTGYEAWTWVASPTEWARSYIYETVLVKDLYVKTWLDPGVGNSYAFSIWEDPANTITATVSGAGVTTGNSGSANATLTFPNLIAIEVDPDSSPTITDGYWGFVTYLTPGVGPGGGGWVVTPPPGEDPPDPNCLALAVTIEDVQACIDEVVGQTPDDPNPPGTNYPDEGATRFNIRFMLWATGLVLFLAPPILMAWKTYPLKMYLLFILSMVLGLALQWSLGSI